MAGIITAAKRTGCAAAFLKSRAPKIIRRRAEEIAAANPGTLLVASLALGFLAGRLLRHRGIL